MCNISMEWKIYLLHDGIKTTRLHNLINHNTNLSDPWLRRPEHNTLAAIFSMRLKTKIRCTPSLRFV